MEDDFAQSNTQAQYFLWLNARRRRKCLHDRASLRTLWLAKQVANIPAWREGTLSEAEADFFFFLPFYFL